MQHLYWGATDTAKVVDPHGLVLFTRADIMAGQGTFLRNGLMEYGSIFGHGAYLGPDYTADYLHRSALMSITPKHLATSHAFSGEAFRGAFCILITRPDAIEGRLDALGPMMGVPEFVEINRESIRLLWSVTIPSHDVLLQDPFDFGDGCRICY
jgi:hypothetical protein